MFSSVELTVGSDDDPAAQAINAMGGKHIQKKVNVSYPLMSTMHLCKIVSILPDYGG